MSGNLIILFLSTLLYPPGANPPPFFWFFFFVFLVFFLVSSTIQVGAGDTLPIIPYTPYHFHFHFTSVHTVPARRTVIT